MLQTNLWLAIPIVLQRSMKNALPLVLFPLVTIAALDVSATIWAHLEIATKDQQHTTVTTPVTRRAVHPQSSQGGP